MEGSSADPFLELTSAPLPVPIPFHKLPPSERRGTAAMTNISQVRLIRMFTLTSPF